MSTYGYDALYSLWTTYGGNRAYADMAAAIALAESGGDTRSVSPTNDYGLWQINIDAHPEYRDDPSTLFDPATNVRAAIAISSNGSNWRPWCTAYADGACGTRGGAYEGSGSPYQRYLHGAGPPPSQAASAPSSVPGGPGSSLDFGALGSLPGTGAPYEPFPGGTVDRSPSMVREPGRFGTGSVAVGQGVPTSLTATGVPSRAPVEPYSPTGPVFATPLPAIESAARAKSFTDDPDIAATIRGLEALGA